MVVPIENVTGECRLQTSRQFRFMACCRNLGSTLNYIMARNTPAAIEPAP